MGLELVRIGVDLGLGTVWVRDVLDSSHPGLDLVSIGVGVRVPISWGLCWSWLGPIRIEVSLGWAGLGLA